MDCPRNLAKSVTVEWSAMLNVQLYNIYSFIFGKYCNKISKANSSEWNFPWQEFVFHWNLKWLRRCCRRKCQNLANLVESVSSHRSDGQMDQIEGKWGNRSKTFQTDFSKESKSRKLSAKGEYEAMSLGANIRRSGYHHTIQGHSEWMKKNQKVKQCAQASTFTMVAFFGGF